MATITMTAHAYPVPGDMLVFPDRPEGVPNTEVIDRVLSNSERDGLLVKTTKTTILYVVRFPEWDRPGIAAWKAL